MNQLKLHNLHSYTKIEELVFSSENNKLLSLSLMPEFFLVTVLFLFFTYGILMKLSKKKKFPDLLGHTLFLSVFILIYFFSLNFLYSIESYTLFNTYFLRNNETSLLSCLISIVTILVLFTMYQYNKKENLDHMEYYLLILTSIFSLSLLLQANEILSFFFLLELQSITSYILAGFNRKYRSSLQAGIKYFIVGGISSIFIIIGFIFFYQLSGSTSFEDLKVICSNPNLLESQKELLYLGFFFLTIGFFGKFYVAPFHWWIVDVYEGSPSTTTLYFSTVPFIVFYYILYKIYFIIFTGYIEHYWFYFLIGAYFSMIIGSIGALLQKRLKRLLAYSSITLLGYLMTLFVIPHDLVYKQGLNVIICYISCVLLIFLFFYNGNFIYFKKNNRMFISYIEDFFLLRYLQVNTTSKYVLAIGIYGILGLPPMPLFLHKFYLLEHLSLQGNWYLSFIFVLTSMISGFYYLYIIKELFYHSNPRLTYKQKSVISLSYSGLSSYLLSILLVFQFFLLFTNIFIFF